MKILPFLLALALHAQTIVDPATSPNFTGGYIYTASLTQQQGVYKALRSSSPALAPFSYDVQVQPGSSCIVAVDLIEPRPAGSDPTSQSAVGTRVFTVTVNGVQSAPVDIFAQVGAQKPYQLALPPVQAPDGHLRVAFAPVSPTHGNPVDSGVERNCTPPPAAPPLTLKCLSPVTCTLDPATNQYTIQVAQPLADVWDRCPASDPAHFIIKDDAGNVLYNGVTCRTCKDLYDRSEPRDYPRCF